MSWWDDLGSAVSGAAGYVWDGITHPASAVQDTLAQIEASQHGFNSVQAYRDWQAKQPQGSVPNNPINDAINNVVNAIPGAAPILANGANFGVSFGNGSADGSGLNAGMNPTPRPNNAVIPGDDHINAAADSYKNQAGPPSVHMFSRGQIDPGTGLQYSGDTTGWVSQQQFAQMNNMPAPTTPPSVMEQQIAAGNARPGDHRTNPQTGVPQTFGIDGVWRDGNSASPPNAVSLPTNPAPGGGAIPTQGVNTNTQNPVTSSGQWDAAKAKWDLDRQAYISAGLDVTDAERRATANNPLVAQPKPGAPGTPGGGPAMVTPEAQNPAPVGVGNPSGSGAPATGAAAGLGGVGDTVSWIVKNLGLDANTAAVLAAGGASSVASWMAANEQANGATNAANTQSEAYKNALTQLGNQIHDTNTVNTNNYTDQQTHLQPYLTSGTNALNDYNAAVKGYDPNAALSGDPPTWQDPGYHFRLDEGVKALQNSAAAKGGLLSGNTLRGITDYAQNAASQEYKNAYDRYNTTFNTKTNALQPLLNSGQQAVSQYIGAGNNYASNTQQAAQQNQSQYANLTTGQGNALAQGIRDASSAKASGYAAGNTIAQGMLSQYTQLQQGNAANNLAKALMGNT